MVLCSFNGLFLFIQRGFKFLIFENKCRFFEFILLPCQIILVVASPTEENYRRRTSLGKKEYMDMVTVLVI